MDLDEGVCAGCGKPLGIRANWRIVSTGQAYHNDCDPPAASPEATPENVESLGEFVERKARQAIYGRGQRTLEDDAHG